MPRGRPSYLAQGLAAGLLVATAAPLALVLAVLFAPTLLAALINPGAGRRNAAILLIYGLAAALPWLDTLWASAQSWPASLDLLARPTLPAACWGAQATAWLLNELAPLATRQILEARVRTRTTRLTDARTRLRAEWGLDG